MHGASVGSVETAMQSEHEKYDAIVIGGGIYGIMIALEASSRGLAVALVERDGWGAGTTSSWLRIIHGGFRYLQHLDLPRFFESVRERRWFLERFPEIVRPLPFVMPLYDAHPPASVVVSFALKVNDLLSSGRNRDLPRAQHIPRGEMLTRDQVREALPFADTRGLRSGILWYDAIALEPERLLLELLTSAVSNGVSASDHAEATGLLTDNGLVLGVVVRDLRDDIRRNLYASVVINACGHRGPQLAGRFGAPTRGAPATAWAWNVLFDAPSASPFAAAIRARRRDGQTYFVLPWRDRMLVGTGHAAIDGDDDAGVPSRLVREFIDSVNEAAPLLALSESSIDRVYSGRLPMLAPSASGLTRRPYIFDHAKSGAKGLFTIWGVKYTTARAVAENVVNRIVS